MLQEAPSPALTEDVTDAFEQCLWRLLVQDHCCPHISQERSAHTTLRTDYCWLPVQYSVALTEDVN
jgi:hypothetical protein